MTDKSSLDDLTIDELEELLEAKRRKRGLEPLRRAKVRGKQASSILPELPSTGPRTSGRGSAGGHGVPSTSHRTSGPEAFRREGLPFRVVEISPLTGFFDRVTSFLGKAGRAFWRKGFPRLRDRLLLLLELAALAALIMVVFSSLSSLRTLNREVAEALGGGQVATLASTPVAVLPGSSFPPDSQDRVPGPYRHLVEPGASIPIPTPGPRQASRIAIPSIGVDAPVVEGDGWEQLKMGGGHHIGSANPGERGNMVISGHNDVYGEIFRDLSELDIGDEAVVYAGDTPYRYVVVAKRIVEPTEVSLLEPTPDATLTLITCYPYLVDTHRLVVIAELATQ